VLEITVRSMVIISNKEERLKLICDFCKEKVSQVLRIALDKDYDRLSPHQAKYACPKCSGLKERARVGTK
jgi:Zn finger protein HypA/HybF involved in hydrogenase expression